MSPHTAFSRNGASWVLSAFLMMTWTPLNPAVTCSVVFWSYRARRHSGNGRAVKIVFLDSHESVRKLKHASLKSLPWLCQLHILVSKPGNNPRLFYTELLHISWTPIIPHCPCSEPGFMKKTLFLTVYTFVFLHDLPFLFHLSFIAVAWVWGCSQRSHIERLALSASVWWCWAYRTMKT